MKLKIFRKKVNQNSRCRGFTVAEVLVALIITGMLMAAIAVSFNASVKNFSDNKEMFYAANKARQALTQIVPRLRTAQSVSSTSPVNECAFYDDSGQNITYSYNSSEKKLYMVQGGNNRVLCDNVTTMSFTKNTGGTANVKSVIISMTVAQGNTSQTYTTAVVIRKNL